MVLKPQDILVMLKLIAINDMHWSYAWLGVNLDMSVSQLHAAVKRSVSAKLALHKDGKIIPNIRNLEEFLVHGLKYVFVPEKGEMTRGMPTAYAAAPLVNKFVESSEPPPVWPVPDGNIRGISFSPIYKLAPRAAKLDPKLYELLVIVDAIRGGRVREIDFAVKELKLRLQTYE